MENTGKEVQQVGAVKDGDGNVQTSDVCAERMEGGANERTDE